MTSYEDTAPLSIRDTAKGIAVRAGILSVAALIVGTWLFTLAAKTASGIVKLATGILLLAIGGGYVTWKVRGFRERLAGDDDRPQLR